MHTRNLQQHVGLACVILLLAVNSTKASGVILQTGFENPYIAGAPLEGQLGWLRKEIGTGNSSAIVQSSIGTSGSQGVHVVRAANSDVRWRIIHVPPLVASPFPSQRFVIVDWDMKVSQTVNPAGLGPFIGVDCYDRIPDSPLVLGSLGVDATTGEVLTQETATGYLIPTGDTVLFDAWNHFRIVFDFQNDTFTGLVNGAPVTPAMGFVDGGFGLDHFTDADIMVFTVGLDAGSINATSSAVFDNYLVRDGLLGDYDIDGDVDQGDYSRWRATFGSTVSVAGNQADGNRNGLVDAADYVVWRNNLGSSILGSPGVGSILAAPAVPEPTSIALGILGFAALLMPQRRRRPLAAV